MTESVNDATLVVSYVNSFVDTVQAMPNYAELHLTEVQRIDVGYYRECFVFFPVF